MLRDQDQRWMIWSNEHRAWWRANSCGYTRKVEEAGLYGYDEAKSICFPPSFRGRDTDWPPPEIMVAEWGDDLVNLTKEHFVIDRREVSDGSNHYHQPHTRT